MSTEEHPEPSGAKPFDMNATLYDLDLDQWEAEYVAGLRGDDTKAPVHEVQGDG